MPTIHVNNINLAYDDTGSGPAVVLIHGYPFNRSLWGEQVSALADHYRVVTPDLRGHGESDGASGASTMKLMAEDVVALMDELQIDRAVIGGLSMGGYVALAFAERHKNRLAGLGLISTQPFADTDEARQARRAMIEKVKHSGTTPAVEAILPKLFSEANQGKAELKQFPIEGAQNAGVEGICWALEAMARRPDRTCYAFGRRSSPGTRNGWSWRRPRQTPARNGHPHPGICIIRCDSMRGCR